MFLQKNLIALLLLFCLNSTNWSYNPKTEIHPGYDIQQLRPFGYEPKVGGLDVLSDGRLVILDWNNLNSKKGGIHILSGVGKSFYDMRLIPLIDSLWEPLGVKVVNDSIYVITKRKIYRLIEKEQRFFLEDFYDDWYTDLEYYHHFNFGFAYKGRNLYFTTSAVFDGSKNEVDRGAVIKVPIDGGKHEVIAGGLRTPNGIGLGPDDEIFVTENQGHHISASSLIHITPNANFGFPGVDTNVQTQVISKSAVIFPYGECMRSPTEPFYIKKGPYQGNMLIGDMTLGKIMRVTLEKVKGQYQGCVYPFSGGFEAGPNRICKNPSGGFVIGSIGSPSNRTWRWKDKLSGLQLLKENGKEVFEIKSVNMTKENLFVLEFSKPVNSEGEIIDNYSIKQWTYGPTMRYGGPKIGQERPSIKSLHLSEDRKFLTVNVSGLKEDRVVHFSVSRNKIKSLNDEPLWGYQFWYTLNKFK